MVPWGAGPSAWVTQRDGELAEGVVKDAEGLPRGGESWCGQSSEREALREPDEDDGEALKPPSGLTWRGHCLMWLGVRFGACGECLHKGGFPFPAPIADLRGLSTQNEEYTLAAWAILNFLLLCVSLDLWEPSTF